MKIPRMPSKKYSPWVPKKLKFISQEPNGDLIYQQLDGKVLWVWDKNQAKKNRTMIRDMKKAKPLKKGLCAWETIGEWSGLDTAGILRINLHGGK